VGAESGGGGCVGGRGASGSGGGQALRECSDHVALRVELGFQRQRFFAHGDDGFARAAPSARDGHGGAGGDDEEDAAKHAADDGAGARGRAGGGGGEGVGAYYGRGGRR